MVDRLPASGSCPRCGAALGLASVRRDGRWYCSAACAHGEGPHPMRAAAVPEHWLYHRPTRYFRKRQPKELNAARREPRPARSERRTPPAS